MSRESGRQPYQAGFSLLELVVVIALIGTLLVVALWRMAGFVREAERVAVLTMEGQMRNILVLEAAKRILNPGGPAVAGLAHSNPMRLMLETPVNYLGELAPRETWDLPQRHWYFDTHDLRLVYRTGRDLVGKWGGEVVEIRYDVRLEYVDADGDGRYTPAGDDLAGVRLHRIGGRGWLDRARG